MIEIPESFTIAKQLNQMIKGKTIQNIITNHSPHKFAFFFGDPALYSILLTGKTIDSVEAYAGLVELSAADTKLVLGDGVNIRYFEKGTSLPKKHQLCVTFEDDSSIVCTVQMYGGMWAFNEGENDDNFYYTVAKEKPSPLSEEFNQAYFQKILQNAKQTISAKALLATEQRIPGLGNGTLQDILFRSRIHPKTKLQALSSDDIENLYYSVKNTLLEMTEKGGRNTEKDIFGNPGAYQTILSKNTLKSPCPVCGNTITREAFLGGNIYFCSQCQELGSVI